MDGIEIVVSQYTKEVHTSMHSDDNFFLPDQKKILEV